jgi:putative ABC transport system permease protein
MLRLTLTQMRLAAGRLAAAGIAVVLGTAFVAATLLAGDLLKATMYEAVSASYKGADVVVNGADAPLSSLATVRALKELDGADVKSTIMVDLVAGSRADSVTVNPLETTPALRTARARTGRLPAATGEIAISKDLADRLRLSVGDRLVARTQSWSSGSDRPVTFTSPLSLVGITSPATGFAPSSDAAASPPDVTRWQHEQGGEANIGTLVAHAAPGVTPERARAAVAAAVAALPGWKDATIRTGQEQTVEDTNRLTRDVDVLSAGLLAFAAVALFVAGLVITNTFQVLVAQRTRALALLRCVGATRKQVRRSVLLEALLLGSATSLTGLVVGIGLISAAAAVLSRMDLAVTVPSTVRPGLASLAIPPAVGILVTLLAALSPARAATRVSPVAALRPAAPLALRSRASVIRLVLTGLLLVSGAGLLLLGVSISSSGRNAEGLLPAIAGGALSFLGVLIGGTLFIPRLVGLIGAVAGRFGGVPARLAAANAVRNPRRTATTSAALLIGVTLVATVSTGAAVLRATLNRELDTRFPVDVMVGDQPQQPSTQSWSAPARMTPTVPGAVAKVPGVADAALLSGGQVELRGWTGTPQNPVSKNSFDGGGVDVAAIATAGKAWVSVQAVDPARASATLRFPSGATGLAAGTVIVPRQVATWLGVRDGDRLKLTADGRTLPARAVVTDLRWDGVLVTPGDLRTVLPDAGPTLLWLRLDPTANAKATVRAISDTVVSTTGSQFSVPVAGLAVERAAFEQAIDTLLLIVTGLLAVAVVIALIGVANTLSLSVIERSRESAVLRALGLTRRQLRAMLAVEGALIAGIGALVGIGLGLVFGWAGAASVIGGAFRPTLAVPFGQFALLLAGGILAGLLASALPGRRAARTPPVAALAE